MFMYQLLISKIAQTKNQYVLFHDIKNAFQRADCREEEESGKWNQKTQQFA